MSDLAIGSMTRPPEVLPAESSVWRSRSRRNGAASRSDSVPDWSEPVFLGSVPCSFTSRLISGRSAKCAGH